MPVPARRHGQLKVNREFSLTARHVEQPAQEFIYRQGVSGILLVVAGLLALAWSNSPWSQSYFELWHAKLSFSFAFVHLDKSLHHWINDGLMTLFFFLVGMEIKHEVVHGHLSSFKRAGLPLFAAAGGMVAPALLFAAFNWDRDSITGWGVPMATDIAFAIGVLALVPRISHELKVLLLALAIVDDIGAIVVIAVFYSQEIRIAPLMAGACVLLVIEGLRRTNVHFAFPYVAAGILFWFLILSSGIHATIAGVILASMVSTREAVSKEEFDNRAGSLLEGFQRAQREGDLYTADANLGALEALVVRTDPPVERLTRALHPWVGFVVLPLFAFANAGVNLSQSALVEAFRSAAFIGVLVGLVVGKPLGILALTWITVRFRITELPSDMKWSELVGVGMLAGIGFTVSIFIGDLAFENQQHVTAAKIAILIASLLAGLGGYVLLRLSVARQSPKSADASQLSHVPNS
jgi:NhaA family Na+:H+ antiporter